MGSHKVVAGSNSIWPYSINSGCFQLHISQNVVKSMPCITSQLCGYSLPAVCLYRQDRAINRPCGHSQTSDRLKKEASVKADCWNFNYSTHMSCTSVVISIKWWWKVNIEIVCKQCTHFGKSGHIATIFLENHSKFHFQSTLRKSMKLFVCNSPQLIMAYIWLDQPFTAWVYMVAKLFTILDIIC